MNQLKQRRPKLISDPRVTKIQEFKTNKVGVVKNSKLWFVINLGE